MAQRTVYDSGPLAGPGSAKHAARLATALRRQYPAKAFTVTVVDGGFETIVARRGLGTARRPVRRIVVTRKG